MGLIKAAKDAINTMMADQWREYFYCDALSDDVMMVKAQKRVTQGRNSNTKGVDNIITNGSIIAVNKGQCMIIVDQGEIVEMCADAGEFVYDTSTEPSVFYGSLGEGIKGSFSQIGRRFTFGGNAAKDQRIYFINTKEIKNNMYGTANPIDFHLVSQKTGLELETTVKCNGEYSFDIYDPTLFYSNVCGNVVESYTRKDEEGMNLISMMKGELLTKLPIALSKIAAKGILPHELQAHTEEITEYLREELTVKWLEERGIRMRSITIRAMVSDEDRAKLNEWNQRVLLKDPGYQDARKTEAFANFMEKSQMGGGNGQGGASGADAMMGMFAMNMMNGMTGGGMMGNQNNAQQMQQPQQQAVPQMQAPVLGWTCSCGHTDNRGKFCAECGAPKPAEAGWTCSCGAVNQGKFCPNCGSKKPSGAPLYKCDKCGWEPEDPAHPPKFCPECGDIFDENDRK